MLTGSLLSQAIGVFGTGVLASLSPCVYPMLPITVGFLGSQAGGKGKKLSVVSYAIGQCLALFVIGIAAVQLGETIGFSSESPAVNLSIGFLLLFAAIFSWKGKLPGVLNRLNTLTTKIPTPSSGGPLAAFLLGASAALVASPCTSPILGGVLALIATTGSSYEGMFLMLMYASGFTLIFFVIGLGVLKMNRLPKAGAWMATLHKVSSVLLGGAGLYFLYQFTQA